jgi:cytoskeletal protein CcmA (bactofilin family)
MAKKTINIGSSINAGDGDPLRTAFDKINDNFDELYSATTLDLDNIGSNMIPDTDGAYALGSASNQWSDLYVKDFVYIGNARLQADAQGNLVVNGASIKVDGDVSGSIFADDSTLLVDAINGKIVGPVEANVTGNLTGNVTGNLTGNVTGNVTGNIVGNTTGYHTGDVTGSVFADDSTIIVDGVSGAVTPSEFKPPMLTQAQIDTLTPVEGLMVYNTTTGKFQGYAADANNDSVAGWADLH